MSNIAGRVLPTVSPEGGPQQIGEIKDYLQFSVVKYRDKMENYKCEKIRVMEVFFWMPIVKKMKFFLCQLPGLRRMHCEG